MKKIVLTGAGGRLGSYLREPLSKLCDTLVSSDLADDIGDLYPGETYMRADVGEYDDVYALLEGADMVVHFAAFVDEGPFEKLLKPNFIGAYNVWEAAFQHKLRRVVYASSIHAVGMHKKTDFIGTDAPHRPDTFYGLAKCFAEDLASMYWDKRGLESVCMRILSCSEANNPRSIGSWLSYDDLIQLVEKSVTTPVTGFSVVYGVSNNDRAPVDNALASHLGFKPKDNAEQFAKDVYANNPPLDPQDPGDMCHGGPFASIPIGTGVVESMGLLDQDGKSKE